jgi:auxin efflux carrier family protein
MYLESALFYDTKQFINGIFFMLLFSITGLRKIEVKLSEILAIVFVRYVLLPVIGIGTVLSAAKLGLVPQSPLFQYVLLIQFTVPPGMSLGKKVCTHNVEHR